ncbi:MAG: SRPBCC family protein [Actinomycetota bacterium]|nr:SRPBCC family protein [Actinomycetota bacterium]
MAEKLVNEFTVNRPIDEAWPVITDVERIAPCLPGAQLKEIEGDVYRGVVKIKLGSVTPQFSGEARYLERDNEAHRAVLKADGRDTGGRGNASAMITAEAESLSPTSTRVVVSTDLHITGKVAQFGRGIIGDVSKKLMAQFANNLNSMLDDDQLPDRADDAPDAGPAAVAPAAPRDEVQVQPVGEPPAAADRPGDATPTSPRAAAGPTAASVRKVDSPASEPVDLAGLAGPAVLKRLAPVLLAALAALFVIRRRRS